MSEPKKVPGQFIAMPLRWPLKHWERAALGFASVGIWALLVTAARLTPAAEGLGTHQQLGLPPCSSIVLFGVRCPACGMTTSWSHFMHGSLWMAAKVNLGGTILAVTALLSAIVLPIISIRGQSSRDGWYSRVVLWLLLLGLVAAFVQWIGLLIV